MFPELDRVLIDRARIARRVTELADEIGRDLLEGDDADAGIVLVPILAGSMIFVADLVRQLPLKLRLGLVTVSSYPGRSITSRSTAITSEIPRDLGGRHVVVIDDIYDSGRTLAMVRDAILPQSPASLRACVLLRKDVARSQDRPLPVEPDYVGFDVPNVFVVGYGLDYDGYYRNLPDIASLRADAIGGAA